MKIVSSLALLVLMGSLLVPGLDTHSNNIADDTLYAAGQPEADDTQLVADDTERVVSAGNPELPLLASATADGATGDGINTLTSSSSSPFSSSSPVIEKITNVADSEQQTMPSEDSTVNGRRPRTHSDTQDSEQASEMISSLPKKDQEKVLKSLESGFLGMLGLSHRPRPRSKVHIPDYIKELYGQLMQSHGGKRNRLKQRSLHSANTVRCFHDQDADSGVHPKDANRVTLTFDLSSLSREEVLKAAEIRLYREEANASNQRHLASHMAPEKLDSILRKEHRLDVHEVIRPATERRDAITRLLDTRIVSPTRSSWETFDVTPAVEKWLSQPTTNHGLQVRFSSPSGRRSRLRHVRLKRSTDIWAAEAAESWDAEQSQIKPFLVTYSDDKRDNPGEPASRNRRSARNNRKKRGKNKRKSREWKRQCRRRTLYVDFGDVGWDDWIVAPPGYNAFYCHGECPFPLADEFNATNHAIVQTLVHSVDPKAVPKPCCVPTELSQISMLYVNEEEKVVLRNYKNMRVEACGCR